VAFKPEYIGAFEPWGIANNWWGYADALQHSHEPRPVLSKLLKEPSGIASYQHQ
jgi:hypothetical protein